ncbi:hypothetical protein PROFUN_15782 [Planoprotostelium fungivorum]|uniref:DZANK-type domain-containing protein n=1 Tax=Planoprotostelium fungivorum TaxID=1890364 RepID=A0A2P6MT49_9EUKA|nr:hypothetical protein PROFUN_15782 [Planoprotostelium fungivorum]
MDHFFIKGKYNPGDFKAVFYQLRHQPGPSAGKGTQKRTIRVLSNRKVYYNYYINCDTDMWETDNHIDSCHLWNLEGAQQDVEEALELTREYTRTFFCRKNCAVQFQIFQLLIFLAYFYFRLLVLWPQIAPLLYNLHCAIKCTSCCAIKKPQLHPLYKYLAVSNDVNYLFTMIGHLCKVNFLSGASYSHIMFCTNCGESLSREGRFCGGCGKQILATPNIPSLAPAAQPQESGKRKRGPIEGSIDYCKVCHQPKKGLGGKCTKEPCKSDTCMHRDHGKRSVTADRDLVNK